MQLRLNYSSPHCIYMSEPRLKPSVLACGFGPPCCQRYGLARDSLTERHSELQGSWACVGWARRIPSSIVEMHGGKGHACVRHAAYPLQLLSKTRTVHVPGTHSFAAFLRTFQHFSGVCWIFRKALTSRNGRSGKGRRSRTRKRRTPCGVFEVVQAGICPLSSR